MLNRTRQEAALLKLNGDDDLGFEEFCQIAKYFFEHGNMPKYEALLLRFDPRLHDHLRSNCIDRAFIGERGRVSGALNLYRKVHYRTLAGEKFCFEKIYKRDSDDYIRMQWFYRNLAAQIPVSVPLLHEIVEGEHLAVCMFEFLPFSDSNADGLFTIVNAVCRFGALHPCATHPTAPDCMKRLPALCETRLANFCANLPLAGYAPSDIEELQSRLNKFTTVFNHGDLHRFNVGTNNVVYDWDCCCFAPNGHEIGRSIASLRDFKRLEGLASAIKNRFPEYLKERPEVESQILIFYLIYKAKSYYSAEEPIQRAFLREVVDAVLRDKTP